MFNSKLKMATIILAGLASASAFADGPYDPSVYQNCNINGLNQIAAHDPAKADSVFFSRLGNNGGGNGGESYDIWYWYGINAIVCTSTADENTGGTLYSGDPNNPYVIFPTQFAPEIDPGHSGDH